MEPLPSELVPGAPGQLSYRYWKRQEKLRLAVEQALYAATHRPPRTAVVTWGMNPRRYLRSIASNLCALALLCAATGAPAQTIYKQVDLAGKVTFTDRPDINLPAQAMTNPALEAPKPPARVGLMTARRSASIDANEAGRRLAQAQLKRSGGADLLPGDWTHGSGEGVPNQRYWQRQDRLRVQVEQAQQRSNETRLALLAQH